MATFLSTEDAEELRKQLEQLCPAAHDVLIEERSFYLAQQVGPPVAIGFIPHGNNTQQVVVVMVVVVNIKPWNKKKEGAF